MNTTRIASLLRELADEFERDERDKSAPRVKTPMHRGPIGEVDDVARARAKAILRAKGIRS